MTYPLAYSTPESPRWPSHPPELSWEQRELNDGARRIYAARRSRALPPAPRLHAATAFPAHFAPRSLALPPALPLALPSP